MTHIALRQLDFIDYINRQFPDDAPICRTGCTDHALLNVRTLVTVADCASQMDAEGANR